MKWKVIPLLEPDAAAKAFEVTDLQPRQFVDLLDQHKALLFQGTDGTGGTGNEKVDTTARVDVDEFGDFVVSLQLTPFPYIGGAAPRTIVPVRAGNNIVFTANESPPHQPIPFHHELAQTPVPPEYLFFYCDSPAESGGQTPIIDSTLVYRFVQTHHPDFLDQLRQRGGAQYIRTLPAVTDPSSPIGRSYQETYNVDSAAALEAKLNATPGTRYEWLNDNDKGPPSVRITSPAVPALRRVVDHCQNFVCQDVFANSIVAAYLGWQDVRNDRRDAVRFGDGSRMDETVLQSIADFMDEHRVLYDWQKGDIMAINNQLVMHSRNPFTGPRRVLASLWGPPVVAVRENRPANGVSIGTISQSFYQPLQPADPLVFGFWKVSRDVCADVCYQAIAAGYRRLDCACDYGNERQVGEGIARALRDGLCQRHELFVTGKLWNTYHAPKHVPLALQRTLDDLQLDYLDEYLIHFPISLEFVPFDVKYPPEWTNLDGKMVLVPNDLGATWNALEDMVEQGLCRSIGVCNFSTQLLRQLLSTCRIRPSTLQIELHPHHSQTKLVRFARDAGLRVTAFSVLGASSYLELGMADADDVLLTHPVIQRLADAHRKTPAQVLIRWALQRHTLPLCKTTSPARLRENRHVYDFSLSPSEMAQVDALNQNRRYNDPGVFCEAGMGTFCPIYE